MYERGIGVGDPIAFVSDLVELGGARRLVAGKAIENRLGCAVLALLMAEATPPAGTLVAAFTTQEEVGMKGAGLAALRMQPTLGLALDTMPTGDTADVSLVADLAGENHDAASIAWSGRDVPAASICLPRRYSHSPLEVAHFADAAVAFELLRSVVTQMVALPSFDFASAGDRPPTKARSGAPREVACSAMRSVASGSSTARRPWRARSRPCSGWPWASRPSRSSPRWRWRRRVQREVVVRKRVHHHLRPSGMRGVGGRAFVAAVYGVAAGAGLLLAAAADL